MAQKPSQSSMEAPMLEARGLRLGYRKAADIIEQADFSMPRGAFIALIGPNGSGKSTILRTLAGALRPRKGHVEIKGRLLRNYSPKALARTLAFLPQAPSAPGDFTVRDLVGYGRFPHMKWNGTLTARDMKIIDQAIDQTQMQAFALRTVASLSGGERQRAWLAMALAQQPEILLLDEPTTFLDVCFQLEVLELVKHLNQSLQISTLVVLHDLNHAARFADRILAVHQGRIAADGPPAQVLTAEQMARIFNIRVEIQHEANRPYPHLIPLKSLLNDFSAIKEDRR